MIQINVKIPYEQWPKEITEQLTLEEIHYYANLMCGKMHIYSIKEIHQENNFKVPEIIHNKWNDKV